MSFHLLPLARTDDLIIQSLNDEILLYDTRTERAHVLNQTAAAVWKLADGRRTVPQLTQLVARELHAEPNTDLVWLALTQLSRAGLLEQQATAPLPLSHLTRREFLQKASLAAMVIPVVKTISSPSAQLAASCSLPGGFCNTIADCCPGTADVCFENRCEDGCFVAGTPVWYHDGTRRAVETIELGDLVLARDEMTGAVAPQPVQKTYVHHDRQAFVLDFGSCALGTTAPHPFYTDAGWVKAGELRAGMDCYLSDGSRRTIQHISHPLAQRQTVYNLKVANTNTFFVGEQGVWVHNKD